jgi:methylmalonyl-CoA mutase C-terminal domain/subunit
MANKVEPRIRILVAKPGLDVHDRGALLLCKAFRNAGMEVIYTGLWQTAKMIATSAVQEDVDAIAVSLIDGQPVPIFAEILEELNKRGGDRIVVIGGGTAITADERLKPQLEEMGITGLYGPGIPLGVIVQHVAEVTKKRRIGI